MAGGILDVEEQFVFYGAYHCAPINILIHVVTVWQNFFTVLLILHFTPPFLRVAVLPFELPLLFNAGFLLTVVFAVFYICLDRRAGSFGAVLCFLCWIASGVLGNRLGFQRGLQVSIASQILCWTGQFIGHGVFEGRAPGLFTNFTLAALMAPFFVLLEVLRVFNYEPYPGFNVSVKAKMDAEREAWKASKQKKNS